jgi:hypothetical protein
MEPNPQEPRRSGPYATFIVELLLAEHGSIRRMRVVHIQTGTEQKWAGRDQERLLSFIGPVGPCRLRGRLRHLLTD